MAYKSISQARKDFDRQLQALLGSAAFTPPPVRSGTAIFDPNPKIDLTNVTPYNLDFSIPPKPSDYSDPAWLDILDILSVPGRIVTTKANEVAEATKDGFQLSDLWTIANVLNPFDRRLWEAGKRGQVEAWKDEKIGLLDIPGLGFLKGIGKYGDDTEDILNTLGWQDRQGFDLHDVVGFAGDVLADPLTYLTFGAGSAVRKAGQAAGRQTAKELAQKAGIQAPKNFRELPKLVEENLLQKGVNPDLAKRVSERYAQKLQDAVKQARVANKDALFAIDIPFTNIVAPIGRKPAAFRPVEDAIGTVGGNAVRNALKDLNITDPAKQDDFVSRIFGVSRAEEMTPQMLDHFLQQIQNIRPMRNIPDANVVYDTIQRIIRPEPLTDARAMLGNMARPNRIEIDPYALPGRTAEPKPSGSSEYRTLSEPRVVPRVEMKPPKTEDDYLRNVTRQFKEFVADVGGKSPFGRWLEQRFKAFNARTLGTGNQFIDQAAEHIRDAETKIFGNYQDMKRRLRRLAQQVKQLSPNEQQYIVYTIENRFPKGKSLNDVSDPAKIQRIANEMSKVLQELGIKDLSAGVIPRLRQNYFPHVIKYSDEQLQAFLDKYQNDPDIGRFLGRSQANRFAQERKSFQTIAELDDTLARLQEELAQATDDAIRAQLEEKINVLSNLFERDPMRALVERYKRSIRSRAMRELYDTFQREGTLVRVDKGKTINIMDAHQFVQLTPEQVRQFGLEPGQYFMHKEVMKGLEQVDKIFTDEGLNKFLNNVLAVQNLWKGLVTTFVPSHYWFNFLGNIANNTLAGVTPKYYKQAYNLLRARKANRLTPEQERLIQEAIDNGVISQGFSMDFLDDVSNFRPQNALQRGVQSILDSRYAQFLRSYGDAVDDFSRLALYLYGKDVTGSVKKAADIVRKYLFNYRELTIADRAVKAVIPFWNFMKRNLPLQLENLLKQPRYYLTYERAREALLGDQDPEELPTWIQESYIKVPGTERTFYNPNLPQQQLAETLDNPLKALLNASTPMIKTWYELGTNKQIFTDRPIDYDKLSNPEKVYDAEDILDYLASQLGIAGKVGRAVSDGEITLDDILSIFVGRPVQLREQ